MKDNELTQNAENEANYLFLLGGMSLIKIKEIVTHYISLPKEESPYSVSISLSEKDGKQFFLIEDKKDMILLRRQTFREVLFLSGASVFETICKDWFSWGLRYSNRLMEHYGKKELYILEIMKSENVKETIISKIIEDINFMNTEICQNEFKKVFEISIFKNNKERYAFQKFMDIRHLFAHNSAFIDTKHIKQAGLSMNSHRKILAIGDVRIKEFIDSLNKITQEIAIKMRDTIMKELEEKKRDHELPCQGFADFFDIIDQV